MQPAGVTGLSIVCVYNDAVVRADCLDRSIADYRGEIDVDYVCMDNTGHAFTSAGAALNHGARAARHDTVVFVHQDVYLHSIDRLAEAAGHLGDGPWGLIGASGVPAHGAFVGRLRDRVEVIGTSAPTPVEVDSVDEVLFMVRRDLVLQQPLSEDAHLAWHAYAVEYGLRLREHGWAVGAVDLAITHNSLTLNLARLDVAHRQVADLYPHRLPLRTTCGTIGIRGSSGWREWPWVREHRWRARWLLQSLNAARIHRVTSLPVVLADLRHQVDLLDFSEADPLHVVNLDGGGAFAAFAGQATIFERLSKPVIMRAVTTLDQVAAAVDALPDDSSVVVTNLSRADLQRLPPMVSDQRFWVVGLQEGGQWMLGGRVTSQLPEAWTGPPSAPFGGHRGGTSPRA